MNTLLKNIRQTTYSRFILKKHVELNKNGSRCREYTLTIMKAVLTLLANLGISFL